MMSRSLPPLRMAIGALMTTFVLAGCEDPACALLGECDVPVESGTPSAGTVSLYVPGIRQQTQVWCWAATAEMVLAYYNRPVPQCRIVSEWLQLDCCSYGLPVCAQTASLVHIQMTLGHFGGLQSQIVGPLSFRQVQLEIDAGRPIIAAYRSSFAGHVVVIYGYDLTTNSLLIHDPFYGSFVVPFGQTFQYAGSMTWAESIIGIGA